MLSTQKQTKKASLIGVKSFQEAVVVLNSRKASPIYARTVENFFKVDLEQPLNRTWVDQQLKETEHMLDKDEKDQEAYDKKMKEMKETTGNPAVPGEPAETSIAEKTGVTGQNDGTSLEDIKDKNPPASTPAGAHAQPGESQLTEAIDQVLKKGNDKDPLNEAIINAMANGMTRGAAEDAAKADTGMMEAVFSKLAAQLLVPIFTAQHKEVASLKETIIAYDQKLESARKENKGLNEAIQIIPGMTQQPIQAAVTPGTPVETKFVDKSAEISEKIKNDIYH